MARRSDGVSPGRGSPAGGKDNDFDSGALREFGAGMIGGGEGSPVELHHDRFSS